jgi:hypothetical protein
LDGARFNEAADYFAAAVTTSSSSSKLAIHSKYEDFVVVY